MPNGHLLESGRSQTRLSSGLLVTDVEGDFLRTLGRGVPLRSFVELTTIQKRLSLGLRAPTT